MNLFHLNSHYLLLGYLLIQRFHSFEKKLNSKKFNKKNIQKYLVIQIETFIKKNLFSKYIFY